MYGFPCICTWALTACNVWRNQGKTLNPLDSVIGGCEPPCRCWELKSGPLKEQSVLLTTLHPSLQCLISICQIISLSHNRYLTQATPTLSNTMHMSWVEDTSSGPDWPLCPSLTIVLHCRGLPVGSIDSCLLTFCWLHPLWDLLRTCWLGGDGSQRCTFSLLFLVKAGWLCLKPRVLRRGVSSSCSYLHVLFFTSLA